MFNSLWPYELQHTSIPCPSLSPWVCSNSCPLSQWYHPTISSSVTSFPPLSPPFPPLSPPSQSFPASKSFPISWHFASSGQSIGASASASVLPIHIQGWFPLEMTGLISLLSNGLSRVFSCTTLWKHQFFGAQLYVPNLAPINDSWKNHSFDNMNLCWQSDVSVF